MRQKKKSGLALTLKADITIPLCDYPWRDQGHVGKGGGAAENDTGGRRGSTIAHEQNSTDLLAFLLCFTE